MEQRCQEVMNLLSQCTQKLSPTDKKTLQDWNNSSNDETEKVRMLTKKSMKNCYQVVTLPGGSDLTPEEVLDLFRGCGSFPQVGKLIAKMTVSNVECVLPEDDDEAPDFIPYNITHDGVGDSLKTSEFFQLVGNLLKPGYLLSESVTFIIAILALPNGHFGKLAYDYLMSKRGSWIKWELDEQGNQKHPVYWSMAFMRILKLAPNDLLTDEEVARRDKFLTLLKIVRNVNATVNLHVPKYLEEGQDDVTWKLHCDGCGQNRCYTIFPGEICGLCITYQDPKIVSEVRSRGHKTDVRLMRDADERKTYYVQCHTCYAVYGVCCKSYLNVRPKCHYCRFDLPPETVRCEQCLNKYMSPGGSSLRAMQQAVHEYGVKGEVEKVDKINDIIERGSFICPRCVNNPAGTVVKIDLPVIDILNENPGLIQFLPIQPFNKLMDKNVKLWKRMMDVQLKNVKFEESEHPDEMLYHGLVVHNIPDAWKSIYDTLFTHEGIVECPMCIDDIPVRNVVRSCGSCNNFICKPCRDGWYSQVKIGGVVLESNTRCPYCTKPPKGSLVRDLDLGKLKNVRKTKANQGVVCDWDPHMVYAACQYCRVVKPALTKECAANIPEIKDYTCNVCRLDQVAAILETALDAPDSKPCPGCGIQTFKDGGCNHITCMTCDIHWCWTCGQEFGNDEIYDHMADCGGIF